MKPSENDRPLVSVCVTFLNSERFIGRIIESCLSQTYDNVEIVLVDDASTDNAEQIASEYAARDKRVRFVKNAEKIGIIKCLEKGFGFAEGKFIIWLGVDDWLARDAIERGVQSFLEHPETAAVMPRVITLRETDGNKFDFVSDVSIPTGVYTPEWIARQAYRGQKLQAALCLFAIFRREDALHAVQYFLENCCHNPHFPEELQKLALQKAYAPDYVFFMEILTRYKHCVSDTSFVVMKVAHTSNLTFKDVIQTNTARAVLKSEHYRILFFRSIYKDKYPAFYSSMKIYTRAQALSDVWVYFLRAGLKPSFFNFKEDRKILAELFRDLSPLETAAAALLSIPRTIGRFLVFAAKKLGLAAGSGRDAAASVFTERFFLEEAGRNFKA